MAIIGGGIIGTSAAAYLAEAGRSVLLVEREQVAAGASGRNSGAIQHPFDAPLGVLHRRSIELYRELTASDSDFRLADKPSGLLILSTDQAALAEVTADVAADSPELAPTVLAPGELAALEPSLAPGLAACRLETAYPVAPAAATLAFARRAERAGARLLVGEGATVAREARRVSGVRLESGELMSATTVLVAAGPWSPALIDEWRDRPPIRSVWGVVVTARVEQPPHAVLEESGIGLHGGRSDVLFSLITAAGQSSVGSTFLAERPDADALVETLLERGRRFVPGIGGAVSVRLCARPVAFDGRPLIGAIDGVGGLFVCAGHGPWGISTGPASAEMVCAQIIGSGTTPSDWFSPRRWG
ncbi:MAG: FAD-dependent oxidoreductase [Chloroflexota bacterium]